jgi:hypothetical protein
MRYVRLFDGILLVWAFSFCAAPAQTTVQSPALPELIVRGDIPSPLVLKAGDLALMRRETAGVPDQDGTVVNYEGVALREILARAGVPSAFLESLTDEAVLHDPRFANPW